MTNLSKISVGIAQLTSGDILQENIDACAQYVEQSAREGAKIIFLPENAFYMRREASQPDVLRNPTPKYTTIGHPGVVAAQAWAEQHRVWIVIGSIAPREHPDQPIPSNRCVVISPEGHIAAHYDKLHLFDVDLGEGERYIESARCLPGEQAVLVDTPLASVGLSICYDVRFPHLYRDLAQAGAQILSVPAAFTVPTGKVHWEILLRARAIENGCFVVAAAQCGAHPGGRKSYGHSMVISPWGEILADLGEAPGCHVITLDLAEVQTARRTIPSLSSGKTYELFTAVSK